jgi:hypothetical protein
MVSGISFGGIGFMGLFKTLNGYGDFVFREEWFGGIPPYLGK